MIRAAVLLVLAALLVGGCAEDPAPAPKPPSSAQETSPAPDPAPPPPEPEPPLPSPSQPPADLEAALIRVAALEQAADLNEAHNAAREARSEFRTHPRRRELDALVARLKEAKQEAVGLPYAVRKLASDDPAVVAIARRELRQAGDVGALYLRKAVREAAPPVAARAAGTLAEIDHAPAAPDLWERLLANPRDPLVETLAAALGRVLDESHGTIVAEILARARATEGETQRRLVGILAGAVGRAAGGDAERFGRLAGDPGAFDFVHGTIQAALASGDPAAAAWAMARAPQLNLMARGLHGQYFEGTDFGNLVLERLDRGVRFHTSASPFPGGREENISVRWTGFLRIDRPGTYTFYSVSDDGQRLKIDGRTLINDWSDHGPTEKKAEGTLEEGLHELVVEFYNRSAGGEITLSWSGPGIDRQVVPADVLLTKPWPGLDGFKPAGEP